MNGSAVQIGLAIVTAKDEKTSPFLYLAPSYHLPHSDTDTGFFCSLAVVVPLPGHEKPSFSAEGRLIYLNNLE